MLKRHTKYNPPLDKNSEVVKHFWAGINEFSEQEKITFIKFCWA